MTKTKRRLFDGIMEGVDAMETHRAKKPNALTAHEMSGLDPALEERKRNKLATKAHRRFLQSGITIRDVFRMLP